MEFFVGPFNILRCFKPVNNEWCNSRCLRKPNLHPAVCAFPARAKLSAQFELLFGREHQWSWLQGGAAISCDPKDLCITDTRVPLVRGLISLLSQSLPAWARPLTFALLNIRYEICIDYLYMKCDFFSLDYAQLKLNTYLIYYLAHNLVTVTRP